MPEYSSRINDYADTTEQIININQLIRIYAVPQKNATNKNIFHIYFHVFITGIVVLTVEN